MNFDINRDYIKLCALFYKFLKRDTVQKTHA